MNEKPKDPAKVAAGKARAKKLSAKRRSEIARLGAQSRWNANLPQATHVGDIEVGGAKISSAVLEDGTRVLTQSDMMRALGRARQAKGRAHYDGDVNLPVFLTAKNIRSFISKDLEVTSSQVVFRLPSGQRAFGYRAELLVDVCEVYLNARKEGALLPIQQHIADRCEILIRGLSRLGIIGLVDEATGYQRDRATDALARILEEFIAKELRPWVKTFPNAYYEQLFRLRGLDFPKDSVKRPQYFGKLTNDIIYRRLAPAVLEELQESTPRDDKGRRKHKFFQRLTEDRGHPKLREHMASVLAVMRLSSDYDDFSKKIDQIHPRYGENLELDFIEDGRDGL